MSQGFFNVERTAHNMYYFINPDYEEVVSQRCKEKAKAFTLAQLKARLENNSIAGEKAEAFVLEFEKKRIQNRDLSDLIRIISEVDVGAGYDIISFETDISQQYDRYIEVKAISKQEGFFWSTNEYEMAKLKGKKYYLYLVDLSRIEIKGYSPVIVRDPANIIMNSDDWLITPETYHIRML